jgi:hypothetical protein
MIPDWLFFSGKTTAHAAVEVGNLLSSTRSRSSRGSGLSEEQARLRG